MRYGITYITNKIIDAHDLDLTLDEKLRVLCPSCNSPLTFVSTINGSKYFKHPKRTPRQIVDSDFQCEQRVGAISPQAIRSYNKIIDQTNIQAFQSHFYKIVLLALGCKSEDLDEAISFYSKIARDTALVRVFGFVEAAVLKANDAFMKSASDDIHRAQLRLQKTSPADAFASAVENQLKVNDSSLSEDEREELLCEMFFDGFVDPAKDLVYSLARMYLDPDGCSDEREVLIEYISLLRGVLRMLRHKDSALMRHFVYVLHAEYLVGRFGDNDDLGRGSELSMLLSEYIFAKSSHLTASSESVIRSEDVILSELHEACKDVQKVVDFPVFMCELFMRSTPDEWYQSICSVKASLKQGKLESDGGFIYVAYNKSQKYNEVTEVKIGKAKDLGKRSEDYRTYSPDGFAFYAVQSVADRHKAEKYIHKQLRKYRISRGGGSEWFELGLEEAAVLVAKYCDDYSSKYGFFPGGSCSSGQGFS